MKVGILGGTFSPIHFGHIKMAEDVLKSGIVDKILYMVAGNPPHKQITTAEGHHRYNMVSLVCDGDRFACSDVELNKQTNYTFDTLTEISAENPENEYYFIMGADMFLSLPKWYRADELMEKFKFIAIDRDNSFAQNKEQFEKVCSLAKVNVLNIKTPEISSTMIRDKIKMGEDVSEYVPKQVADYIKDQGLYL